MPVDHSLQDADANANDIFTNLTDGSVEALPSFDASEAAFDTPAAAGNPLYTPVERVAFTELTDGDVAGTGLFDQMMRSVRSHLQREWEDGRITGKEYSDAYIALTQTALGTASQFLMTRDQAYWQAIMAQKQAQSAEVAVVTQRLDTETARNRVVGTRAEIQNMHATFALRKMQLLGEDSSFHLAEVARRKAEFELDEIMPVQKLGLQAEVDIKGYQLTDMLPTQKADMLAQTDLKEYELGFMLPKELEAKTAQILGITASTSQTDAQTAQVTYQTANILPAELGRIDAQTTGLVYETSFLQPAQLGNLTKQTEQLDYTLDNLMPKQVDKLQKEIEAQTAQISASTAATNQTLYQTSTLLPAQLLGLQADTSIKDYQRLTQLPAQTAAIVADTANKTYTNANILPAQLTSLVEQNEAHRAKTMDTRSDGITMIAGSIGVSKELQEQQIASYKRDSEAKVVKMILDTWIIQKSADEGLPAPVSLSDDAINSAMTSLRNNLNLPTTAE